MSEHAVAAMLYPIIFEIIHALNLKKEATLGKSMFFGMAWGCIIGGAATVLGGGRVPLAVEILEQTSSGAKTIGLTQYSVLAFPMVLIMGFCGWAILLKLFHPGFDSIALVRVALRKKTFSIKFIIIKIFY